VELELCETEEHCREWHTGVLILPSAGDADYDVERKGVQRYPGGHSLHSYFKKVGWVARR